MQRQPVLRLAIVFLLLLLLHARGQAEQGTGSDPDLYPSSGISLSLIGRDYLDLPDAPGPGQICVDSAENIWVMARDKPFIFRYSMKKGLEEVIPWDTPRLGESATRTGILCVIGGSTYALKHVEAPGDKDRLSKRYELYLLKPNVSPVFVQSLTVYHRDNPFSGMDPYITALNSSYVYTTESWKKGIGDELEDSPFLDTCIWRTGRASGEFAQTVTLPRLSSKPVLACDDDNLYLVKGSSGLRVFDAITLAEKKRYAIPSQHIGEVTMLVRAPDGLYAANPKGEIAFLSTNKQGVVKYGSPVVRTGKVSEMHSFYPCGGGFVALGSDVRAGGNFVNAYYFPRTFGAAKPLHKIDLPMDVVYDTGLVAASGDTVCLTCGSTLKIVEKGQFTRAIEAKGAPSRISINEDGIIAYIYSEGENSFLAVVDGAATRTYRVPQNLRGTGWASAKTIFTDVEADNDGAFLVRTSGKHTQTLRFDPKKGEFATVFEIEDIETLFNNMAVLPGGNIVLASSYAIQIRDREGNVVAENPEPLYQYGEIKCITYSHCADRIFAICDTVGLLAFEPSTLDVELVVTHSDLKSMCDIAAGAHGELYAARRTHPCGVFRVSGVETLPLLCWIRARGVLQVNYAP